MHFLDIHFGSNKGSKASSEQPRSSIFSENNIDSSGSDKKKAKKMSVAEDYWSDPVLNYGFVSRHVPKSS
jgi:hypothetical protein